MQKSEDLISIIVPVYKVQDYLSRCIDSILCQTYKNFELILVDDGSPDDSGKICDEYAKKDKRIKVIHKQNGGAASARNMGLNKAKGDYISFIDSDDYVEPNFIESLFNHLVESKKDISVCSYIEVCGNSKKAANFNSKIYEGEDRFEFLFNNNNLNAIVPWDKLYKKEVWQNLRFPEGTICEDEFVIYDIIKNAKNGIIVSNEHLYYYLIHENSVMGNKKPSEKMFAGIACTEHRLNSVPKDSKYYAYAVKQSIDSYLAVYKKVKTDKSLKAKLMSDYKKVYKDRVKFLRGKNRIKAILLRYFPGIYSLISR